MTKEDKILLTARYVEGDMDSFEQQEYELRLKNEPDLKDHLKDYKEIHESFQIQLPFSAVQQSFFSQNGQNSKHCRIEDPDIFPFKPILKWFVMIGVGIMAIFLFWAPWNVNLYRTYAYYQKIAVPKNFSGDTTAMYKAIYLYNDGNYLLAGRLLASQYAKNPKAIKLAYAYANTLIETAHLDEARVLLESVIASNDDLKFFAEYSMALSYLREENYEKAGAWLAKIPKSSGAYPVAEELSKHL
ncbi:tetratricopeptide (TPR) repeat protein [Pedobacter sp. UYEF25]